MKKVVWLSLNPENGKTSFITQCSYLSTDSGYYGEHEFYIDHGLIYLEVNEYDEMGKVLQDSAASYKQKKR